MSKEIEEIEFPLSELNESGGKIRKAYSADTIGVYNGKSHLRGVVQVNGLPYANVGGCWHGDKSYVDLVELIPEKLWEGEVRSYGDKGPGEDEDFYLGVLVKCKRERFVMGNRRIRAVVAKQDKEDFQRMRDLLDSQPCGARLELPGQTWVKIELDEKHHLAGEERWLKEEDVEDGEKHWTGRNSSQFWKDRHRVFKALGEAAEAAPVKVEQLALF